ncbi:hypothetical protein D9M71_845750 [compost metagenome]
MSLAQVSLEWAALGGLTVRGVVADWHMNQPLVIGYKPSEHVARADRPVQRFNAGLCLVGKPACQGIPARSTGRAV